jgi:hypothetical protein
MEVNEGLRHLELSWWRLMLSHAELQTSIDAISPLSDLILRFCLLGPSRFETWRCIADVKESSEESECSVLKTNIRYVCSAYRVSKQRFRLCYNQYT